MTAGALAVGRDYVLRRLGNGEPIEGRESLGGGDGTRTDSLMGDESACGPGRDARSAPGAARTGLLSGHISSPDPHNPFDEGQVELWEGASLVKVIKQGRGEVVPEQEQAEKSKRGRINSFSRRSRRRMMLDLAKVRLADDTLPIFGTTT